MLEMWSSRVAANTLPDYARHLQQTVFGHCPTASFLKGFQVHNSVSSFFWLLDGYVCFSLAWCGQTSGLSWARNAAPTGAANAAQSCRRCASMEDDRESWQLCCQQCMQGAVAHTSAVGDSSVTKSHICCGTTRVLFQSLGCRYVYRCPHSLMLW